MSEILYDQRDRMDCNVDPFDDDERWGRRKATVDAVCVVGVVVMIVYVMPCIVSRRCR